MNSPSAVAGLLRRLPPIQPAILLGIGFTLLIALSAATVWLADRAEESATLVTHTFEVEGKITQVQLTLRRAESSQRGYLLTGDTTYRDRQATGAAAGVAAFTALKEAVSDNPRQAEHLAVLEPLARAKLEEMAETLRLYDSGSAAAASALVQSGRGRDLMDEIIEVLGRMRTEESNLLRQRRAAAARANQWLLGLSLLGTLLIVGLAGLAVVTVRRQTEALQETQTNLAATNEGLEEIVEERTVDLREANEEIQRFAYIVSHDLRAPLVNIMGFTTELEDLRADIFPKAEDPMGEPSPPDPQREMLAKDFDEAIGFIKASIAKMDRLINAILNLSREGRRKFNPEPVDVKALLGSIAASSTHQADEANATVSIGALPPVTSDRLALEQIFSNLIDNAIKYLRPGVPGEIAVEGRSAPRTVIYEVKDNGRGIEEKDRERVFELFRRAGVQDRAGEGIGLAHVRALVRRLGGTIALTSEPGQGSTFTVTLPKSWIADRMRREAA